MINDVEMLFGKTGNPEKDGFLNPDQQFTLEKIQKQTAEAIFTHLKVMTKGELFPAAAMATGIGKGKIIHHLIEKQLREKPDSKILIIAGTKIILVDQSHKALSRYQDSSVYIESTDEEQNTEETELTEENLVSSLSSLLYKTGKLFDDSANVHIATMQTIQSKVNNGLINPEDYDLVIVDEMHNTGTRSRKALTNQFVKAAGFTATPYRSSGVMKTPEDYGFKVISSLSLIEAQNLGLLPPLVGLRISTEKLVENIPTNDSGKIDFKQLEKLLKNSPKLRPYIADNIEHIVNQGEDGYKTVIVVNFVWEAQELAELLYQKGYSVGIAINKQAAKELHTEKIPTVDAIERYKLPQNDKKSVQVLISPYVASEGFDAPFTEVLVWASPTDSSLRYTQYTGRLARRAPGKAYGLVVDFLFQTNKYKWAYNMGMWMKDEVIQLDNGLLWLGPNHAIENTSQLPHIKKIAHQKDFINLNDERNQEILEVQENDFKLTRRSFFSFKGNSRILPEKMEIAVDELRKIYPSFFAIRKTLGGPVEVFIDKNIFIREMKARGFRLREESDPEVEENHFPLSRPGFRLFKGDLDELAKKIKAVATTLRKAHPDLFAMKKSGNTDVEVCLDKEWFITKLLESGFVLKEKYENELLTVQEGDFPLTRNDGLALFKGTPSLLSEQLEYAIDSLKNLYPNMFELRKNKGQVVNVTVNKEWFLNEMVKLGFELKKVEKNLLAIQANDFPLTIQGSKIFKGEQTSLHGKFLASVEDIKLQYPTYFANRRNGNHIVEVFIDRDLLISELIARGFKLKKNA